MSDVVHVGQQVPDFEMEVYNPKSHALKKSRWPISRKTKSGRYSYSILRTTRLFAHRIGRRGREI
jgi:hypothetical protein